MTPYEEGLAARDAFESPNANPYNDPDGYTQWADGWNARHREIVRAEHAAEALEPT